MFVGLRFVQNEGYMGTAFILVLIACLFEIFFIWFLAKACNTLKKNRDELNYKVLELNSELEFLKKKGEIKNEILEKSDKTKSTLNRGNSDTRYSAARNILQNNKS